MIEDNLPERFRAGTYHPSLFIYAFKRAVLDKLFEELLQSNIAVLGGELWVTEGEQMRGVIPVKNGDKTVLNWKIKRQPGESWFDFVERSVKETLEVITNANLEKKVTAGIRNKLFYHFDFAKEP